MFAHQVNKDSQLCVLKFEGSNACETIDLDDNYGRNETFFVRYFFSKVYGSSDAISPFDTRFSDNRADFQERMDTFFEGYASYLSERQQLSFDKIILKVRQVDESRHAISPCERLGYYDVKQKKYVSSYENSKSTL